MFEEFAKLQIWNKLPDDKEKKSQSRKEKTRLTTQQLPSSVLQTGAIFSL